MAQGPIVLNKSATGLHLRFCIQIGKWRLREDGLWHQRLSVAKSGKEANWWWYRWPDGKLEWHKESPWKKKAT